jgi:hypothetical protein
MAVISSRSITLFDTLARNEGVLEQELRLKRAHKLKVQELRKIEQG